MILETITVGLFGLAAWSVLRGKLTAESRSWHAYEQWESRCRATGMTTDEIANERYMREQFAIIQTEVSFHVLTAPDPTATWEDVLKRQIEASARFLASLDPATSRRFIKWISGLHESDILTRDAYARLRPPPAIKRPSAAERRMLAHIRTAAFTDRR